LNYLHYPQLFLDHAGIYLMGKLL